MVSQHKCFSQTRSGFLKVFKSLKHVMAYSSFVIGLVDVITNWIYLFTQKFYSEGLFTLSALIISGMPAFIYVLLIVIICRNPNTEKKVRNRYLQIWVPLGLIISAFHPLLFIIGVLDLDDNLYYCLMKRRAIPGIIETSLALFIQGINNNLLDQWSNFSLASFFFSALNIINSYEKWKIQRDLSDEYEKSDNEFTDFLSKKVIKKLDMRFSDEHSETKPIKKFIKAFLIMSNFRSLDPQKHLNALDSDNISLVTSRGRITPFSSNFLSRAREIFKKFNPFKFKYSEYQSVKKLLKSIKQRTDYSENVAGFSYENVKEIVSSEYRKLLHFKIYYKKLSFEPSAKLLNFLTPIVKDFYKKTNGSKFTFQAFFKNSMTIKYHPLFFLFLFNICTIICNLIYISYSASILKFIFAILYVIKLIILCIFNDNYKVYFDLFFLKFIFGYNYSKAIVCIFSESIENIKETDYKKLLHCIHFCDAIIMMIIQIVINEIETSWKGINIISFMLNIIDFIDFLILFLLVERNISYSRVVPI